MKTNYVWGFVMFWALGLVASLAGNLLAGGGEEAGIFVLVLEIALWGGAVYLALKKKARGFVPGMVIAAVVFGVGFWWSLRGNSK